MCRNIEMFENKHKGINPYTAQFGCQAAENARQFHREFKEYQETPLRSLSNLAENLGLGSFWVKDESFRFGLNAFKALGGSYAVGRILQELGGGEQKTFVTATDGNHGRGIAWAAKHMGQKAVVYMPKGSAIERLENIRALGAKAEITDLNYDDAVRYAKKMAEENDWVMVQDTAWEGYEKIPAWIMTGYTTMALEAAEQLKDEVPTHIFLQAGVGAMAGAVTAFFREYYQDQKDLKIIIVEPWKANCMFKTAKADDGKIHTVTGDMDSIMAGLCCGEPCTIGWRILHGSADAFISCPDYVAADGMRVLGNPLNQDERIISGESGAVTTGIVYELMTDPEYEDIKHKIGLDKNSRVLCISTEGDTDRENYRKIVWEGKYHRDTE